jgi:glyceraldehyde 3-phosphate dehydrogenase
MKKVRVAINGLGRIGRSFFKLAWPNDNIEIVAVNDLGTAENLAYLLRYDSAYGKSNLTIDIKKDGDKGYFRVDGRDVMFLQQREPALLPWNELDVDVVVESTGFFTSYDKAKAHLDAGAKRVVISAPVKGDPVEGISGATVLMGVNEGLLEGCQISSNASCTTNAASPLVQILHETIGIEKAMLNTTHGYTATQAIVDAPDAKDFRRGRAAAQNIVPSTTGAAEAVTQAITDLAGKFDGISMRVPVITGSIADITFLAKRNTTVEEVNTILKNAAKEDRWNKVFTTTEEPLVSSDIIASKYAAIADLGLTKVVDGNLVKVLSWYDNEAGYTHAMIEHVIKTGQFA